MSSGTRKIYVVEDDKNTRLIFELTAKSLHGEVQCFDTAEEGLQAIRASCPDLLITDFQLLGSMNGIDLIKAIRTSVSEELPIILLSGVGAVAGAFEELMSDDAHTTFIPKPFSTRALASTMKALLLDGTPTEAEEEND